MMYFSLCIFIYLCLYIKIYFTFYKSLFALLKLNKVLKVVEKYDSFVSEKILNHDSFQKKSCDVLRFVLRICFISAKNKKITNKTFL